MSVYKATITLIIVALVLFGSFVALSTGVLNPMIEKIGSGFNTMVDNVFGGEGMPK